MKCEFCKKPHTRLRPNSTTIPARYCSTVCIKRASYVRKNPEVRTHYGKDTVAFLKTETGIGYKWEKWAAKILGAKHITFNKNGCDLDWNGHSIDVKAAELWRRGIKRGIPVLSEQSGTWTFNRGKMKPCDFFFCVCLVRGKVKKCYLIPGSKFPKSGAVIGQKSKYDKYQFYWVI